MPYDPLTQYRSTLTPDIPQSPGGATGYVAFGTKDKVKRLRIHPANAPTHSLAYNILLDVVYDRKKDTGFILVYTMLMVMVEGNNLKNLVFALQEDRADYIQEFDPTCWAKPTDANAAFIKSIKVQTTASNPPAGELKQ